VLSLVGALFNEALAKRFERDARDELFTSLLGKSQTFHDRQRVGDIMARATDDTQSLSTMVSPGLLFIIVDLIFGFTVPTIFIATVNWQLVLVPVLFIAIYAVLVRSYVNRLSPVVTQQRALFGKMNAGLEETITGIEVVKAASQEMFERFKFRRTHKHIALGQPIHQHFLHQRADGRVARSHAPKRWRSTRSVGSPMRRWRGRDPSLGGTVDPRDGGPGAARIARNA